MPESPSRFSWVTKLARVWTVLALVLVGLAMAATVARVVTAALQRAQLQVLLWWALALLGEAVVAGAIVILFGLVQAIVANEHVLEASLDRAKRLESIHEAVHQSTRRLVDLARMSDAAKSLLFRDREVEAMHELLLDDLIRQDYAKAEALVNDIERRFGYVDQVQRMRGEIAAARETTVEQKVDAGVQRIRKFIDRHDWAQATRNTRRLLKILPGSAKIAAVPQMIRQAQIAHKRDLLKAYGEAVRNGDIDRSIELIRELDKYLTPQEAAALEDSARGVFRAKLHNLGVQFAIRATEEQWLEAVDIGEQIINEYPNSRMAQEVRTKMETLRTLAAAKQAQA